MTKWNREDWAARKDIHHHYGTSVELNDTVLLPEDSYIIFFSKAANSENPGVAEFMENMNSSFLTLDSDVKMMFSFQNSYTTLNLMVSAFYSDTCDINK